MSLIFEALQRSQSSHSDKDLWEATELLQHVEGKSFFAEPRKAQSQEFTTNHVIEDTRQESEDAKLKFLNSAISLKPQISSESHLICLKNDESLASENFRFLGVKLRHLRRERSLKKLLITSTIPGEGKSTVAANLACVLAKRGQQKTLLLEGDVRRPSVLSMFGIDRHPGLCEWLEGRQRKVDNVYRIEGTDLWVLPAGRPSGNPTELLQSPRLAILMEQLSLIFDWVIIDSPPVLPLADTSVLMRISDGVLLVVRHGVTQKAQLQRGLDAIDSEKVVGTLLNAAQESIHASHYYYYKQNGEDDRAE